MTDKTAPRAPVFVCPSILNHRTLTVKQIDQKLFIDTGRQVIIRQGRLYLERRAWPIK